MSRRPAPDLRPSAAPGPDRRLLLALAALVPLGACAAPEAAGPGPMGALPAAGSQEPVDPDEPSAEDAVEVADEEAGGGEAVAEAAAEGEAPSDGSESGSEGGGGGPTIDGYVTARSRSRWNDEDDDDHNVYAVAAVDIETGGENPWSFHFMGRGQWQIDGPSEDSVFFGIEDTYDSAVTGRLYYAFADAPKVGGLDLVRVGRQQFVETPATVLVDGLRVETERVGPAEFLFGMYGGFPVRLFRDDYTDQLMGGVYAALRPWRSGEMRFDFMHLVDDPRFGADENDLLSFALRQDVGRNVKVEGTYGLLDGESRDVRLAGSWLLPEQQLSVRYTFYNLFEPQSDFVNELNPFFDTMRTWYPFYQNQLAASKLFGEWLELQLGLDLRRVTDDDDIGRFNRDFDRYFLTATLIDQLPFDTSLGLTGEIWEGDGNDIDSWGLDLTSRWSEAVRTSIGTFYSLYKYYLDIDEERTDVRTWYVEFRDQISAPTDILVRYDFEDDELFQYHTLRFGITWKF